MQVHLKIGEFAKLSGVTVKTVLHYHQIGLLPEPVRSSSGYRLYGTVELQQMRSVKRLKSLGLRLDEIRSILGFAAEPPLTRDILLSLQAELESQKTVIEDRLVKIQDMLNKETETLVEDSDESSSFKMILDILGEEAKAEYQKACPELYEQERQIWSVIDELQWGFDSQDLLREVGEYFKEHPEQYQQSLLYGPQITAIAHLPEDSPVIEELARDYGTFLKSLPLWEKIFNQEFAAENPLESLMDEMLAEVLGPAQMKLAELLRQYLIPEQASEKTEAD